MKRKQNKKEIQGLPKEQRAATALCNETRRPKLSVSDLKTNVVKKQKYKAHIDISESVYN